MINSISTEKKLTQIFSSYLCETEMPVLFYIQTLDIIAIIVLGRIHPPLKQDINGTLMDDSSVKQATNITFFAFHPILMKLGEVVVCATSPSFIKIG